MLHRLLERYPYAVKRIAQTMLREFPDDTRMLEEKVIPV